MKYEVVEIAQDVFLGQAVVGPELAWRLLWATMGAQEQTAVSLIQERGQIGSKDLADKLGVGLNHAGTVLLRLADYGVVERHRERGGLVWRLASWVSVRE